MSERFIPYIPDLTGTDSQRVLELMYEYYDKRAKGLTEAFPDIGKYFSYQEIAKRIIMNKKCLFEFYEPGMGKTCSLTNIDEYAKTDSTIIGVLYVTPRKLIKSTQQQILCKCTAGTYMTAQIKNAKDATTQASAITRSIKTWYKIITPHDLYTELYGKTSRQIDEMYSGYAINIDEPDELLVLDGDSKDKDFHFDVNRIDENETLYSKSKFIQAWRLCMAAKRTIRVLATGTPATNFVYDGLMLINLVLEPNNQIPVSQMYKNFKYTNLKTFERYFNGIITYVSSQKTNAYPDYQGYSMDKIYKYPRPNDEWSEHPTFTETTIDSQIVLYNKEMHGIQCERYASELMENSSGKSSSFFSKLKQIMIFTDSMGNIGKTASLYPTDLSLMLLNQYSSTNLFIVRKMEERWNNTNGMPGCGYCHIPFTEAGGYSLEKYFMIYGYESVQAKDIYVPSSEVCADTSVQQLQLTKGKRIAFIDGSVKDTDRLKLVQALSTGQNVFGEYIQLIIASNVFDKGVNIGNVVIQFAYVASWNEPAKKQQTERTFRADSHDNVKKALALKERNKGNNVDPESIRVPVEFYNMNPFSRLYYFSPDNIPKINSNHFFQSTSNGQQVCRLDSRYIVHLIGFRLDYDYEASTGDTWQHNGKFLSETVKQTEIPHEKIDVYFSKDIVFIKEQYGKHNMVISQFDIIYTVDVTDIYGKGYLLLIQDYGHFNKVEFMRKDMNGYRDYSLYTEEELLVMPMQVHSTNEIIYTIAEEKSIETRKLIRYMKQYALDCKLQILRNTGGNFKDGSVDCDYQICNYKCVVDVAYEANDHRNDREELLHAGIRNVEDKFFNNYELLFSEEIVKECKQDIIDKLFEHGTLKMNRLYTDLKDKYRDYFIYKAISSILYEKTQYTDKLGFTCYIASNKDILTIKKEFPLTTEEKDGIDYYNKLIANTSRVDFELDRTNDDNVIAHIESLTVDPYGNDPLILPYIHKMIQTFVIYESNFILLEKALKRIIVTLNTPNKIQFPIDAYIHKYYNMRIHYINGYYIHNHPNIITTKTKHNEISAFMNATIPFRVFDSQKLDWRWATSQENTFFAEQVVQKIKQEIENSMVIFDPNTNTNIKAKYYLTYIYGTFRLVDAFNPRSTGKDLQNNIKPEGLAAVDSYFGTYFSNSNNFKNDLITYFASRNLIFYFTYYIP